MEWFKLPFWSPYVAGACIGVLSWLTFYLSDKPIGCSTAFARTSGMIEKVFNRKRTDEKPYYRKFKPVVDWGWMLVLGIPIGAFISAGLSGTFNPDWIPSTWENTFGNALIPRLLVALIGGIFIGFGSRWSGGCTSGHGISGCLQLTISSWLAVISFFAGGIITAMIIFRITG